MKSIIAFILFLAVIGFGVFYAATHKASHAATLAAKAESDGDYRKALSQYTDAFLTLIPNTRTPDINRSKTLPPDVWKKEMARYAVWSLETNKKPLNLAKRRQLLDGLLRNEVRVDTQNFINTDSIKACSPEQYTAVWNRAFFGRGVAVNPDHAPVARECFAKSVSLLSFGARTSYTYELSLVDTQTNRRTTFTVYPESYTHILAAPGNSYMLICKSSYKPQAGKIWHSNPAVIPLTVPPTTSIMGFLIETSVKR